MCAPASPDLTIRLPKPRLHAVPSAERMHMFRVGSTCKLPHFLRAPASPAPTIRLPEPIVARRVQRRASAHVHGGRRAAVVWAVGAQAGGLAALQVGAAAWGARWVERVRAPSQVGLMGSALAGGRAGGPAS